MVEVDERFKVNSSFLHEGKYGLWEFVTKINSFSLLDVKSSIGEWAFVYLTLQKYIVYTLFALGVLGCVILVPIYSTGDSEVDDSSNKVGIAHIITQPSLLTAPLISIFAFTFVLYVLMYFFYRATIYTETKSNSPEKNFVLISKVPQSIPYQDLNEQLLASLQNQYGDGVLDVYAIPYYYPSYSKYDKYEEAIRVKKKLRLKQKKTGKRPMMCYRKTKRIDAINYWKQKIKAMKISISELKKLAPCQNLGRVYVLCESEKIAEQVISTKIDSVDFDTASWHFRNATHPQDIIWKNVGKSKRCAKLVKFAYNFVFIVIFMVCLTPTTFSSYIVEFFGKMGIGDALQGILGIYFPSLLLMIYQNVGLPKAVGLLVRLERHTYKHGEVSSALVKYLLFMTFYGFLFPLLGLKFVELFQTIYGNGPNWQQEFAKSVNNTGIFYTTYIIHLTFLSNGSDLLLMSKYFTTKSKLMIAKTPREKAMAYAADSFNFSFEFANTINVFMIVCSFSLVFPIILLPSIPYFTLRYLIHKQNLLAIYYIDPNSSGCGAVLTVLCGIATSAFSMQVITGATIIFCTAESHSLIAKIMTPAWICLLILAIIWYRVLVNKRKAPSVDCESNSTNLNVQIYFHPFDKEEMGAIQRLETMTLDKLEEDLSEKNYGFSSEKQDRIPTERQEEFGSEIQDFVN